MKFASSKELTEKQVKSALNLLVKDGLASEAMATLTGGAFLVAFALKFGASNFQIGLIASLPTFASLFQLLAIYLVYKVESRKTITIYGSVLGRIPLLLIGILPFLFSPDVSLNLILILLFFHHFFGSIAGCTWGSWTKDIVPEKNLGSYFSHRSRLIQILNVVFSLILAYLLDYVKEYSPSKEVLTYSMMFVSGGIFGLAGVYILANIPEPKLSLAKKNFIRLFLKPFRQRNFRNLLIFNSFWAFAVNLAAPFFTVYLLKMLNLSLSYVVTFAIISQVTNILFIKVWGRYTDKYSNKTILRVCAPLYILCILAWTFTTLPDVHRFTIPLLVLIHVFSGIAVSGINLSLSNIGLKMAPKGHAIVFLSVKSLVSGSFAAIAPLIGGLFADFFASRELAWTIEWKSPEKDLMFYTLDLQSWDFFFAISVVLGIFSLYRLSFIKEEGEVGEKVIMNEMAAELVRGIKPYSTIAGLRSMIYLPYSFILLLKNKVKRNFNGKNKRTLSDPEKIS